MQRRIAAPRSGTEVAGLRGITTDPGSTAHLITDDAERQAPAAWRSASSERRGGPRSQAQTSGTLVGRACELERLARGLHDVPVALICGVPGVGKSALALAHAARWPEPTVHLTLATGASIAQLVHAIERRLGAASGEQTADAAARLDELWAVIERRAALLVLDDLHWLAPEPRRQILESAAQRLRAGRLVATSRELVPISTAVPDRMQLRLNGLDRGDATELWVRLVELYGPGGDFDAAWRRSLGHPGLLRQAHVAMAGGDHPLAALARSLDVARQRIAGALALGQVALPRELVLRVAGVRDAAALDDLVNRLVVDMTPDGRGAIRYAIHEPVRELVLAELSAELQDELRAALVDALPDSELDAAAILREAGHHLRALGRHGEVPGLLATAGARLVRQGATGVLVDELLQDDRDPPGQRADRVSPHRRDLLLRAQVQTALRAACSALAPRARSALDAATPGCEDHALDRALVELARAVLAARQGRQRKATKHLDAATRLAAQCQADPALIPALHAELRARASAGVAEGAATASLPGLVIDGARHEVIDGAVHVSLAARIVLRRLLYAFVAADGHYLDHGAICRALWGCDYAPLRHDSSIKSNIRRLRDLLEGTRAAILAEHGGYRLAVPPDSVLIAGAPESYYLNEPHLLGT